MQAQTREVPRTVTIKEKQVHCAGPGCDRWFRPNRRGHVYCSSTCRQAAYDQRKRSTGNLTASDATA